MIGREHAMGVAEVLNLSFVSPQLIIEIIIP
jgi:hypothetical protein